MTPTQINEKIMKIQYSNSRILKSVDVNRKVMRNGLVRLELLIGFVSLNTMEHSFNTHKIGDFARADVLSKLRRLEYQIQSPVELGFSSN